MRRHNVPTTKNTSPRGVEFPDLVAIPNLDASSSNFSAVRAPLLGAIEGGGTKFVCAVGEGYDRIVDERRIVTREPHNTLDEVIAFFQHHGIAALGVGMFGPLELRAGQNQGALLETPKPGWGGSNASRIGAYSNARVARCEWPCGLDRVFPARSFLPSKR